MSDYRTTTGEMLRDPRTGAVHEVVAVYRSEDLHRFIDPFCYLRRPLDERSALHGGGSRGRHIRSKAGRS